MTFSLDDETVASLRRTAARHRKPQSWVVREAVSDYAAKADRLTADERQRILTAVERFRQTPATGTRADVEREIHEVQRARRAASAKRSAR